jgi:hypothetical protein
VIVRPYEAATRDQAVLTETGESFMELAARRATPSATDRNPKQ